MPKNKVSEWSSTPSNNTDIGGINIAEGCAPSGINNAIRELMAQVKDMQAGTDSDGFVIGGSMTCSGAAVFSSTVAVAGISTFTGNSTFSNNVAVNGNATIGNGSTDAHVLSGTLTFDTAGKLLLDDSVTTATAPALAFDGDTNTGIYRPAADTLSIATNGAERLRVADAGVTVNQAMTCSGAVAVGGNLSVTGTTLLTGVTTVGNALIANSSSGTSGQALISRGSGNSPQWGTVFVSGMIMMWSGSIASIPAGWLLCDGSNSTPDLRNRFVVGAGSTYAVNATGGSADAIVVSHTHTGSTSTAGLHNHGWTGQRGNGFPDGSTDLISPGDYRSHVAQTQILDAGSHSHTFTTNATGSSGTNANLPPYFALCFIMKS
jgi:hypothetical protein